MQDPIQLFQIVLVGLAFLALSSLSYSAIRGWVIHHSPVERALARAIEKTDLPEPTPQFKVYRGRHLVTIPDFAWPAQKVAVFCDGWRYHGDEATAIRDAKKRNYLSRNGWVVLVFHGKTIYRDMPYCLEEIRQALMARRNA